MGQLDVKAEMATGRWSLGKETSEEESRRAEIEGVKPKREKEREPQRRWVELEGWITWQEQKRSTLTTTHASALSW